MGIHGRKNLFPLGRLNNKLIGYFIDADACVWWNIGPCLNSIIDANDLVVNPKFLAKGDMYNAHSLFIEAQAHPEFARETGSEKPTEVIERFDWAVVEIYEDGTLEFCEPSVLMSEQDARIAAEKFAKHYQDVKFGIVKLMMTCVSVNSVRWQ